MRRTDREITDDLEKIKVLEECKVCRIGMNDNGNVYVVPLNFGYTYNNGKLVLYFHCAKEGRAIDVIKENNHVCVEMDCEHSLITADVPCKYGYTYASLIGNGTAKIVENTSEKIAALTILMKHQTGKEFSFDQKMVGSVAVIKVDVADFSCKRKG